MIQYNEIKQNFLKNRTVAFLDILAFKEILKNKIFKSYINKEGKQIKHFYEHVHICIPQAISSAKENYEYSFKFCFPDCEADYLPEVIMFSDSICIISKNDTVKDFLAVVVATAYITTFLALVIPVRGGVSYESA